MFAAVPSRPRGVGHAPVDWLGAALTFCGLAGPVLALIRQPVVGWSSPQVNSEIESLMKWTLPSQKQEFTPPVCMLRDMAESLFILLSH